MDARYRAPLGLSSFVLSLLLFLMPSGPASGAPGDNELVSVDMFTGEAAGQSYSFVAVSRDGRYIAFDSYASMLVAGDTNGAYDIFVRDRATGITERVSKGLGGVEANGDSRKPSISADGRYVAFNSTASNLVASDVDGTIDLFRYDRATGLTSRVNTEAAGGIQDFFWDADISDDGRFIVFEDRGTVFVRDLQAQTIRGIHVGVVGHVDRISLPTISGNGRFVLYRSMEPAYGLYVYDRWTGSNEIVPGADWTGSASMSSDGRFVAYVRTSNYQYPPPRIYLLDRETRLVRGVSTDAAGRWLDVATHQPSVSDDGRYVAFQAMDWYATYVKDMSTAQVDYVTGAERQFNRDWLSLSGDGRYLGFPTTIALVPIDRNSDSDVYLHEVNAASPPQTFQYHLQPLALDYGSVKVGATQRKGFTLSNVGEAALPISVIEVLGPNRSQFQMKSYCGASLAAGQPCWISVTFAPTSAGAKQANLHVVAGGIQRYRALRGTGTP
jgi:Tol biopolymer transport system component